MSRARVGGRLAPQAQTRISTLRCGQMPLAVGRHYKTLSGTVGLPDDVPSDTALRVELFGDGRPLFNQDLRLGQAIPVTLDMTNVLRLRLQVSLLDSGSSYGKSVAFADMRLE